MSPQEVKDLLVNFDHRYPLRITVEGKVQMWCSICSMHYWHNPECKNCLAGNWREADPATGDFAV